MRYFLFAAVLVAGSAQAQDGGQTDSRILALSVPPDGALHLRAAVDLTQTILFPRNERIGSVILSDPRAFTVNVAGGEDSLALRAATETSFGIMTVRTNVRTYAFELIGGRSLGVPAVIRLVDQPALARAAPTMLKAAGRFGYSVTGGKAVRPVAISDDGSKTYISWSSDQAIPATFALGPTGDEQIVDGYMREGVFTIDRVYQTLIFRIDKVAARATREQKVGSHG